ncbi:hypothetical protein [Caulobacter sp. S45]|uniref:hypothetical protein n=1 Tax=Caulobacter sp. S45 TaxID=1641861 RepID=UPI00131C8BE7|nr:hypothetical protein [Caulobacter sp. S45]
MDRKSRSLDLIAHAEDIYRRSPPYAREMILHWIDHLSSEHMQQTRTSKASKRRRMREHEA